MANPRRSNGRPKVKTAAKRLFRLSNKADGFIESEKKRTGKSATAIVEELILLGATYRPAARDAYADKAKHL